MATNKTAEPLVFTNAETGETVIVEFNRSVILRMERDGYSGDAIPEKAKNAPMSTISTLFWYGMLMHQPDTTMEEGINFFFDNVGTDENIMDRLTSLFTKPYEDMLSAQRKNSRWTVK